MLAKENRIKDDEVYEWNVVRFYNEIGRLKALNEMIKNEQFMARNANR